jgi:hypothetical protein
MSHAFADVLIPQEYGKSAKEKLDIARLVCKDLSEKMLNDLLNAAGVESVRKDFGAEAAFRFVHSSEGADSGSHVIRTRLYFTSESHINCLVNLLRLGPFQEAIAGSRHEAESRRESVSGSNPPPNGATPNRITPAPAAMHAVNVANGFIPASGPGTPVQLANDNPFVFDDRCGIDYKFASSVVDQAAAAVANSNSSNNPSPASSTLSTAVSSPESSRATAVSRPPLFSGRSNSGDNKGSTSSPKPLWLKRQGSTFGAGDGSGQVDLTRQRSYMEPGARSPFLPHLDEALGSITELSFLSQITCRLYEDHDVPFDSPERVRFDWVVFL